MSGNADAADLDVKPMCPHCEEQVTPAAGGEPDGHSGVATVWICPECGAILGVSEWMD